MYWALISIEKNSVYYYSYERTKETILRSRTGDKGLSTLESMLSGLIAGSAATIMSNPLWVMQTSQVVRTLGNTTNQPVVAKELGFFETVQNILAKDGLGAFWGGLGPALILVINPIIQYTAFEQLKNSLVTRRTSKLRVAGAATAVAILSDLDLFFLGAISKLIATGITYPYMYIFYFTTFYDQAEQLRAVL